MTFLLQLLIAVSIIIALAKLAGSLSAAVGQPPVLGKILAGLILGPSLLNMLGWPVFQPQATETAPQLGQIIHYLAEIGVILLMFIAGLETDIKGVLRVGNNAFWAAAGGVALPMGAGTWFSYAMGLPFKESIFIGTILTATSVSITAQTLMELGALKSKEGSTILGAAVIDDVMGIIVLSLVVAFSLNPPSGSTTFAANFSSIIILLAQIALFFAISIFIGIKFFDPILKYAEKLTASKALFAMVIVLCFVYAWAAEYLGKVAAITGSYIAGVLLTRTKYFKEILEQAKTFAYPFFVPIFLIDIGLRANARELGANIAFTAIIILIAIATKVIGCAAGSLATGFKMKESARVGIGMISRGEVGLIVASYGLTHAVINRDIFSAMILMVLVTTLITPILLRLVFPKKQLIET